MSVSALIGIAIQLVSMTGLGGKLGHLLGGDNGEALANKVISIASAVTGEHEPDKALASLQTDKDKRLEFEDRVFANEEQLEQVGAADRQDARSMQEQLLSSATAGWFARNFLYMLTAVMVTAALVYLGAITFVQLTPTGERYADLIVTGIIGAAIGGIIKFFYGGGGKQADQELGNKRLRDLKDYGQ